MDAGADDYLTKPFNAHELRVRLHAGRRILDLQEELLKAREALREQATHDGLTGLLNRNSILEALDDELSRAARAGQPVSVLMADLDRFKSINDTTVIWPATRCCAKPPAAEIRRPPLRFGGPLWRRGIPHRAARLRCLRRRRCKPNACATPSAPRPSSRRPSRFRSPPRWASPAPPTVPGALVREADDALYEAKAGGRNRWWRIPVRGATPERRLVIAWAPPAQAD
jgi:two-component system cell cycle response regulator